MPSSPRTQRRDPTPHPHLQPHPYAHPHSHPNSHPNSHLHSHPHSHPHEETHAFFAEDANVRATSHPHSHLPNFHPCRIDAQSTRNHTHHKPTSPCSACIPNAHVHPQSTPKLSNHHAHPHAHPHRHLHSYRHPHPSSNPSPRRRTRPSSRAGPPSRRNSRRRSRRRQTCATSAAGPEEWLGRIVTVCGGVDELGRGGWVVAGSEGVGGGWPDGVEGLRRGVGCRQACGRRVCGGYAAGRHSLGRSRAAWRWWVHAARARSVGRGRGRARARRAHDPGSARVGVARLGSGHAAGWGVGVGASFGVEVASGVSLLRESCVVGPWCRAQKKWARALRSRPAKEEGGSARLRCEVCAVHQ